MTLSEMGAFLHRSQYRQYPGAPRSLPLFDGAFDARAAVRAMLAHFLKDPAASVVVEAIKKVRASRGEHARDGSVYLATADGKVYIGEAVNFNQRKRSHRYDMEHLLDADNLAAKGEGARRWAFAMALAHKRGHPITFVELIGPEARLGCSKEFIKAAEAVLINILGVHSSLGLGGCNMHPGSGVRRIMKEIMDELRTEYDGVALPEGYRTAVAYARRCVNCPE